MESSYFSDNMSDEVTIAQQRREELAAMVPPSESSNTSANSRRTEQWVDETCRDRTDEAGEGWPNSNMTNELVAEEGCSRAPPVEEIRLGSQTETEQDLTYVGGMSYARQRGLGTTLRLREAQESTTAPATGRRATPRDIPRGECGGFVGLIATILSIQGSIIGCPSRNPTRPGRFGQHSC